jgi:hypothetical protein
MREKGTVLGEVGKDILLGWFAAGPIVLLFWLVGGLVSSLVCPLVLRAAQLLTRSASVSQAGADWYQFFLTLGVAVSLCVLSLALLSRRYKYLAWSFVVSALLACGYLGLLFARIQGDY